MNQPRRMVPKEERMGEMRGGRQLLMHFYKPESVLTCQRRAKEPITRPAAPCGGQTTETKQAGLSRRMVFTVQKAASAQTDSLFRRLPQGHRRRDPVRNQPNITAQVAHQ